MSSNKKNDIKMSETFKNHAKVCTSVLLTLYLLLTCSSLAILIWFMFIKDAWQENEYWGWWLHQSSRWGLRHAGHGWKWNYWERGYRVRRQMIPSIALSVFIYTILWLSQDPAEPLRHWRHWQHWPRVFWHHEANWHGRQRNDRPVMIKMMMIKW